jgi:hypothetical protein
MLQNKHMTEEDTFRELKRRPFNEVLVWLLSPENNNGIEAVRITVESMGWTIEEANAETYKRTKDGTLLSCLQQK